MAATRRFFHWELEFPDVFFGDDGAPKPNPGFDAVIGNPPWEKISATSPDKAFLDPAFEEIREGEINFYNLFIHRAHGLTAGSNQCGLLVPNTWLINKYTTLLRKFVLTNFETVELLYMCKQVFPDAPDTIPLILQAVRIQSRQAPAGGASTRVKVVDDEILNTPTFLERFRWEDKGSGTVWFKRPLHQMSVYDTCKNQPFLAQLEKQSLSLGELAHASDGIYKSTVESFRTEKREAPSDRPVVESADQVSRYSVEWAGSFIPAKLWEQHAELHTGAKIILHAARKPKLERRLVAGYSTDDLCFSNRFILLKMTDGVYSPLFVLALVNSSPLNRYFKIRFPITDVDGYMLHQLPIRQITFTTPPSDRKRLAKAGQKLYEAAADGGDGAEALRFAEEQLAVGRSDVVHDLLAYLAERMMELNRQKQAAARQFLADLKDFHGVEARRLNPKTRLEEFWKLEAADVFAHLRKNVKLLAGQGVRLKEADEERIRDRFQKATGKLVPLESQIEFTDRLIDRLVYRLYGLMAEEIKLVEESVER